MEFSGIFLTLASISVCLLWLPYFNIFVINEILRLKCLLSFSGWEVAGDHIQSGAGGSDNDYLILTLHIPGFK